MTSLTSLSGNQSNYYGHPGHQYAMGTFPPNTNDFARAGSDLTEDADLASKGDHNALGRLLDQLLPSAWAFAFTSKGSLDEAARSVVEGFFELMRLFSRGLNTRDTRIELFQAIHFAGNGMSPSLFSPISPLPQNSRPQPNPHPQNGPLAPPPPIDPKAIRPSSPLAGSAFRKMTPVRRQVVWLTESEGLSGLECSQVLGISGSQVEQETKAARTELRLNYLNRIRKDSLGPSCMGFISELSIQFSSRLPKDGSQPRGFQTDPGKVAQHASNCKRCGNLVLKLDDFTTLVKSSVAPQPPFLQSYLWALMTGTGDLQPATGQSSKATLKRLAILVCVLTLFGAAALAGYVAFDHYMALSGHGESRLVP